MIRVYFDTYYVVVLNTENQTYVSYDAERFIVKNGKYHGDCRAIRESIPLTQLLILLHKGPYAQCLHDLYIGMPLTMTVMR